jgi:hypothetical protein
MNLKLWVDRPLAPVPPEFRPSFRFDRVWDRCGFGAGVRYQLMLRSRSLVRAVVTSTVVAAAIALAGCTSDGTPASTENSGSVGSFVRNLFGIKSEDQAAVAHNEASVEPPAPKTKPATSKPKHPAVAAAGATQPKSGPQPGPSARPQKTSAQPRKKAKQPAGQNEKAHAKREQEAPRATAPAKGDKPAVQEQAADSISQKPAEAAPTVVPSSGADQPLNAESRNENLVTAASAAWPIIPNTEVPGAGGAAADTTEAANANAVQLVDPNEVNELDRAAETAQGESSWSTYLLLLLGAALAAASATWFLVKMSPVYARRAAGPRMHTSEWQ